jgi:hypothetical protein
MVPSAPSEDEWQRVIPNDSFLILLSEKPYIVELTFREKNQGGARDIAAFKPLEMKADPECDIRVMKV